MARLAKTTAFALALTAGLAFLIAGPAARHDRVILVDGDIRAGALVGTRWRIEVSREWQVVGPPGRFALVPLVPPLKASGELTIGQWSEARWGDGGFEISSTVDLNTLFDPNDVSGLQETFFAPGRRRFIIEKRGHDWRLQVPPPIVCQDCGLSFQGRFGHRRFVGQWVEEAFASVAWGHVRMWRLD